MNVVSEEELIARCRSGDSPAYAPLVETYGRRVFAICLGMLGNVHDAEDMAQQALLKGFTSIQQVQDGERFGSWIYQIAKNLCLDFMRKRKARKSCLLEQTAANRNNIKEYPALERALAKLPDESRLVLMLYYIDGQNTKIIADCLSISEATVHTRLSRARKRLRKLLETERGE